MMWIIITIILAVVLIVIDQLLWYKKLANLQKYLMPVLKKYNLEKIPLKYGFRARTWKKQKIFLCLRHDYNMDDLSYVALHEYAHILSKENGHGKDFVQSFTDLINTSQQLGIKISERFTKEKYC